MPALSTTRPLVLVCLLANELLNTYFCSYSFLINPLLSNSATNWYRRIPRVGGSGSRVSCRRRIADLRLRTADLDLISKASINRRSIIVSLNPKFEIRNPKLLNDSIRPREHVWWDGYANLLGGFQVDDEFKLG